MHGFTLSEEPLLASLALFVPLLLVPGLVALVDFITITHARLKRNRVKGSASLIEKDFSILVPIFGDMKYLKNAEYLRPYGSKVVLCTTTEETEEFNRAINHISKQYGFRVFRSEVPLSTKQQKPNPWNLFRKTLAGEIAVEILNETLRDEMVRDSLAGVDSKYCVFLDGDTVTDQPLEEMVGALREQKLDLASVRVLASRTKTIAEKLQSIEYELSMDARKVYPWLISGAGMIATTKAIHRIMEHHSLFFQGGDIEIGKLAKMLKMRVGHLPFLFWTDVPTTLKAWFRQRVAWGGGGFRHAVVNIHRYSWRHPIFFLYNTVVVYFMTPLRWYEVAKYPIVLLLVIVLYWVLVYLFHWKQRKWYFLLFPFYALVQVMIVLPLGVIQYFRMALHARNIGHIRLRHPLPTSGIITLADAPPVSE